MIRILLRCLLPLHAPVLEPGFDLQRRQFQTARQFESLACRQVVLTVKPLLQIADLDTCNQ